jgi:DNA polymerase-4
MPILRHIIHLHIPAFSIAVERVCRPGLRDRPVAMAPPRSERALIFSASPEARKERIFKGMPLAEALKRCPGLLVLPPNPELTEKACQDLGRVVARYTPLWEPSRPGHIYLDLTGTERLWGKARDAAHRFRGEIETRLCLSGAVGVAGNKMVSSIASRVMASQEIMDVDHGREAAFMAPLNVNVVPGVGRVRRKVLLEELNITRVRELALLDMGGLRLIFGRRAGLIHQRALGIDPTPVRPAPAKPMVSEQVTLAQDENDDQRLLGVLYGLVEKCGHRLRSRGLVPHKAGLLIRYADQAESRRRITLPHASFLDFDLYAPLEGLFFKACRRRVRVRFMKAWFGDLRPVSSQLSLFHTRTPREEKKGRAIQAVDRIRERHGPGAIAYGRAA